MQRLRDDARRRLLRAVRRRRGDAVRRREGPPRGETPEATLARRVLSGESPAAVLRDARGDARFRQVVLRLERLADRRGSTAPVRPRTSGSTTRGSDAPIEVQDDPIPGATSPVDAASRLLRTLLGTGD